MQYLASHLALWYTKTMRNRTRGQLIRKMHPKTCKVKENSLLARLLSKAQDKALLLSWQSITEYFHKQEMKIQLRNRNVFSIEGVLKSTTWVEEEEEEILPKYDKETRTTWSKFARCLLLGRTRITAKSKLSTPTEDGHTNFLDTKISTAYMKHSCCSCKCANISTKIEQSRILECHVCGQEGGNLVRFLPYKSCINEYLQLTHGNKEILLHHVCVNSPDLQFLSEASIRKVYGCTLNISLALAETRSAVDEEGKEYYLVEEFEALLSFQNKMHDSLAKNLSPLLPNCSNERLDFYRKKTLKDETERKHNG